MSDDWREFLKEVRADNLKQKEISDAKYKDEYSDNCDCKACRIQ